MGKKATPPRPWQTGQPHKHFHRLYEDLTESEAFKTLSPQAITIYVIIASQYKERFTDDKYGKDCVMCPYSRFKNITTNTSQIKKYLKELRRCNYDGPLVIEHEISDESFHQTCRSVQYITPFLKGNNNACA